MISRYFHTIRHLKVKQIYSRILFYSLKPSLNNSPAPSLRILKKNFCFPIQKNSTLFNEHTFHFLNKSEPLSVIGWNDHDKTISKLWRYNQHYFDDLNAKGASKRKKWHDQIINNWINENISCDGVGWDSYPTSLRIVNWIKWYLAGNKLPDHCLQSLAIQIRWLSKRIEWHILGNHLIANAKALIFAGLFFSGNESKIWLDKGLKILKVELKEQILDDGGHFELSPMYHSIVLEDILDIINISKINPESISILQINEWKKVINKMFRWLDVLVHPDGDISFFNDAALEVGSNLTELKKYANRLNINYSSVKSDKVTHLVNSGYVRLASESAVALIDVAKIGPKYLPGHAHADTLSFELSLFNQRLLVNSGTSEYENSTIRKYERGTKAHNTVEINNKDSSEVWDIFRVARRATPFDVKIDKFKNSLIVCSKHDGYKHLEGKPVHQRIWNFFDTSLIIQDEIQGSYKDAYAYFHFHPSVNISKKNKSSWDIKMSNNQYVNLQIKTGNAQLEKFYYAPEFGKKIKSCCLKVSLYMKKSCVKISWNN